MLTPLDIENKKFQKQMMNGYNVDDCCWMEYLCAV